MVPFRRVRPPWKIITERHELWLAAPGADRPGADADRLGRDEALRAFDRALLAWAGAFSWRAVAEVAREVSGRAADDLRATVRRAIADGRLEVWRGSLRQVVAPPPAELAAGLGEGAATRGEGAQKTWIEIELTDMEGNPMAGERYSITLPDGAVREGALDARGRAYFGGLDPGECEVRWPARDGSATVPGAAPLDGAVTPRERSWIEIELTDDDGGAVPRERYSVTLPDGEVREGRLDALGRAYFGDIPAGACQVRWPDRDDSAHVAVVDATVGHPESDGEDAQAQALVDAARDGAAFCEECERARRALRASA